MKNLFIKNIKQEGSNFTLSNYRKYKTIRKLNWYLKKCNFYFIKESPHVSNIHKLSVMICKMNVKVVQLNFSEKNNRPALSKI